jgi:hypothetical protein
MIGRGSARPVVLALVLLGLVGGIAYEAQDWSAGPTEQRLSPTGHVSSQGAGSTTASGSAARPGATAAASNRLTSWRDQILSRPLFSPDRRPAEKIAHSVNGLSRLTGIIGTDSRRVAIFAAQSGGAPIVVEEGAHIGAYDVQQITDTTVTVTGPEGTTVIRPNFDAAVVARPKTQPVPSPAKRNDSRE